MSISRRLTRNVSLLLRSRMGPRVSRSYVQPVKTEHYDIPETLLIHHAGTGRVVFLAMLKLTTLMMAAFFCLLGGSSLVPRSKAIKDEGKDDEGKDDKGNADEPPRASPWLLLCGIAPALFIAYTTSPLVTHIHMHLPASARLSRPSLARFLANTNRLAAAQLTLTTMSLVATPRHSRVLLGRLKPVSRRMGIVNCEASDEVPRRWFELPPVRSFYVQPYAPPTPYDWVWRAARGEHTRV